MRVIFMGNPEFSLPTLKALIKSNHELVGVVSNTPKPMGRGRQLKHSPVGQFSRENNLLLIEADSLKSEKLFNQLTELRPDIFVVVAYRILPKSLIELPKYGALNLHASLLPKYRGAGPIQWALMNGDEKTGVTVFQIVSKMDRGDILLQMEMGIEPNDTMLILGMRLCNAGADLVVDALNGLENSTISARPQNNEFATSAPKISKEMTIIDWTWSAKKIHNWIRGLSPRPGMSTQLNGKNIRIYKTKVMESSTGIPGEIIKIDHAITVATGEGALSLIEIQAPGKQKMKTVDFLRGFEVQKGNCLGS